MPLTFTGRILEVRGMVVDLTIDTKAPFFAVSYTLHTSCNRHAWRFCLARQRLPPTTCAPRGAFIVRTGDIFWVVVTCGGGGGGLACGDTGW